MNVFIDLIIFYMLMLKIAQLSQFVVLKYMYKYFFKYHEKLHVEL